MKFCTSHLTRKIFNLYVGRFFFGLVYIAEKETADCITLIESWLSPYCSVSLPRGAMGWPVVCDCGISWSNSLTFCVVNSEMYTIKRYHVPMQTCKECHNLRL